MTLSVVQILKDKADNQYWMLGILRGTALTTDRSQAIEIIFQLEEEVQYLRSSADWSTTGLDTGNHVCLVGLHYKDKNTA